MRFTKLYMALLTFFAAGPTGAAIIKVEVGRTGLRYAPDNIKAAKGDIVEFHFDAMHSVVAGDFAKPCTPVASGGFYSGFLPSGDQVSCQLFHIYDLILDDDVLWWSFRLLIVVRIVFLLDNH